jgi:hypothetical protein
MYEGYAVGSSVEALNFVAIDEKLSIPAMCE